MFLIVLGSLLGFVATATFIWLAVLAFRRNVGWGLAVLFVPFAYVVFAIKHWDEAKKPFFWTLGSSVAAVAFVVVGFMLTASSAMQQMQAQMMNDPQFAQAMREMQQMNEGAAPAANASAEPAGSIEAMTRRSLRAPQDPSADAPAGSATTSESALPAEPATDLRVRGASDGSGADLSGDPLNPTIPVSRAHKHVGERMRILGPSAQRMTAKLVEIRHGNLVFEQSLGAGTVRFEMTPAEIRSLEPIDR